MAHGQVLLADAEDAGALGGGPDAEVGQGQTRAVEHVAQAPDLILLVVKQGLEYEADHKDDSGRVLECGNNYAIHIYLSVVARSFDTCTCSPRNS